MSPIRFIAGSGRSGTTWIQDSLAAANGLRPLFEPLHPFLTEAGRLYAHRALAAEDEHGDLKDYFLRVCSGRGPRLWTQYRQQLRWLFPPSEKFRTLQDAGRVKRYWTKFIKEFPKLTRDGFRRDPMIKCIRANLMLPWIARNLACRVVLIVRHPGAVVESELRGKWNPSFVLERFRNDARLHELTGGRYLDLLSRNLSPLEALAARWVVENQWVMETAPRSELTIFHYEYLRMPQNSAWMRLCSELGLETVPNVEILKKPSQQSRPGRKSVPIAPASRPRWMHELSAEQKHLVQGILESVEFSGYSMDDPNPIPTTAVCASLETSGACR
jgi:hypothetical protein